MQSQHHRRRQWTAEDRRPRRDGSLPDVSSSLPAGFRLASGSIQALDLSLERIEAARGLIPSVFLDTPQFVHDGLSAEAGCEVVVKIETLNPIGSFKGRGTWMVARDLDPERTWVCATAGNFGQGLAFAARERGARVQVFAASGAPPRKVERMRELGAQVEVSEGSEADARAYAEADPANRVWVKDGLDPAIAEGAGTIGAELEFAGPFDAVLVQVGDGALISGVARWLRSRQPQPRIIGVCASGAPAMARSFEAGHPVSVQGDGTIAAALAITDPVPESLARVRALVDDIVLVDDEDLRSSIESIAEMLGVLVEPAGAAGVAALRRHREQLAGGRVAVLLTGAGP
jgi:threonine dehydratase